MQKQVISMEALENMAAEPRSYRSMRLSLLASPSGIIAEFKRRSPSKGWIKQEAQAEEIPPAYAGAGAAALSILTDEKFFGGSLRDLRTARPLVNRPILRKEFIIDEYQLLQTRVAGADAVLLIAACLHKEECAALASRARELGLEVLLELHDESELDYLTANVDMVGINNRHLGSFATDVQHSFTLAATLRAQIASLPQAPVLVSESGISSPDTVKQLRDAGFRGFLIGETFMKTEAPGDTLRHFIQQIES